jgi:hypothetical protein
MGEGRTEEGHDAVPGELVDGPLVPVDLVHEDLEARIHDLVDLLGVELLGEGGEVGDIGEKDGDELSLTFYGAASGKDLVGQELGGVGVGLGVVGGRDSGNETVTAVPTKFVV